jgi:hypothetical protein
LELHRRFLVGAWRVDDVRETILQGLIAGDMPAAEASKLTRLHFDPLPKLQFVELADAIVMAELVGPEEETLGEPGAGEASATSPSRAEKSGSATTTASAQP